MLPSSRFRCESMTPFGRPVVPEEKGMMAITFDVSKSCPSSAWIRVKKKKKNIIIVIIIRGRWVWHVQRIEKGRVAHRACMRKEDGRWRRRKRPKWRKQEYDKTDSRKSGFTREWRTMVSWQRRMEEKTQSKLELENLISTVRLRGW